MKNYRNKKYIKLIKGGGGAGGGGGGGGGKKRGGGGGGGGGRIFFQKNLSGRRTSIPDLRVRLY